MRGATVYSGRRDCCGTNRPSGTGNPLASSRIGQELTAARHTGQKRIGDMHESIRAAQGSRGFNSFIPTRVHQLKLSYYGPVQSSNHDQIKLWPYNYQGNDRFSQIRHVEQRQNLQGDE